MCETCSILREQLKFLQEHLKQLSEANQATINGLLLQQRERTIDHTPPVNTEYQKAMEHIHKTIAQEGYELGSDAYAHTRQWAETKLAAGVPLPEVLLGIREGGKNDYDIDDVSMEDLDDFEDIT